MGMEEDFYRKCDPIGSSTSKQLKGWEQNLCMVKASNSHHLEIEMVERIIKSLQDEEVKRQSCKNLCE